MAKITVNNDTQEQRFVTLWVSGSHNEEAVWLNPNETASFLDYSRRLTTECWIRVNGKANEVAYVK
jgi:hypothetical protein